MTCTSKSTCIAAEVKMNWSELLNMLWIPTYLDQEILIPQNPHHGYLNITPSSTNAMRMKFKDTSLPRIGCQVRECLRWEGRPLNVHALIHNLNHSTHLASPSHSTLHPESAVIRKYLTNFNGWPIMLLQQPTSCNMCLYYANCIYYTWLTRPQGTSARSNIFPRVNATAAATTGGVGWNQHGNCSRELPAVENLVSWLPQRLWCGWEATTPPPIPQKLRIALAAAMGVNFKQCLGVLSDNKFAHPCIIMWPLISRSAILTGGPSGSYLMRPKFDLPRTTKWRLHLVVDGRKHEFCRAMVTRSTEDGIAVFLKQPAFVMDIIHYRLGLSKYYG